MIYYVISNEGNICKYFKTIPNIKHITTLDEINNVNSNYKVIPLIVIGFLSFINCKNCVFINDIQSIDTLNNKVNFAKFMMNNFIDNISETFYYSTDNEKYINPKYLKYSGQYALISKPSIGLSGNGVYLINTRIFPQNSIISKYIIHNSYYSGHILVNNGIIIKKIFFHKQNNEKYHIERGAIKNYEVLENINVSTEVFDQIFFKLNYSGFACIDFCINENIIKIFEINPRIGASLLYNEAILTDFFISLVTN